MNYLIIIIAAALIGAAVANITFDPEKCNRIRFLKSNEPLQDAFVPGNSIIVAVTVAIGLISGICGWMIAQNTENVIDALKMLLALWVLIGSGCVDVREKRIPNIFPLILAVGGIVLLAIGYFTGQDGAVAYVLSSVFATVCCALSMGIISLLTKSGIGAGDIKLLCALAIIGGVHLIIGTVLCGIILCAVVAAVLLVSKKETLKSTVPFGPFILAGYVIAVLTTMY